MPTPAPPTVSRHTTQESVIDRYSFFFFHFLTVTLIIILIDKSFYIKILFRRGHYEAQSGEAAHKTWKLW